jgi:hypothetical protein
MMRQIVAFHLIRSLISINAGAGMRSKQRPTPASAHALAE